MANSNIASGLTPIDENGTPWSGQVSLYYVPASQGTAIFRGDPLIPLGGSDAFGVPSVGLASAGGGAYCVGSMVSIASGPAAGGNAIIPITRDLPTYHPASTAGYILVADDPLQEFVIQEDSIGGALTTSSAWLNADLVSGVGSTVTGWSGWQLDSSTANTTNTLQLRILGLPRGPDNALGVNAKWRVRINLHSMLNTTGI